MAIMCDNSTLSHPDHYARGASTCSWTACVCIGRSIARTHLRSACSARDASCAVRVLAVPGLEGSLLSPAASASSAASSSSVAPAHHSDACAVPLNAGKGFPQQVYQQVVERSTLPG